MASNAIQWTDEQRAGIETTGTNLLVSAAAGSGKTAVLAARCAHLVCDSACKCDIDELLVVTFTQAAAAEMRGRIEAALRKRLETTDDSRLARQVLLIDRAAISTLHGFCTTVLRQHFNVLGLDPNFRVLDEDEVALLRREVVRELLDQRYETDSSGQFQSFVDLYANGYDQIVLNQVTALHNLMCSVVDRDRWLDRSVEQISQAVGAKSIADSELGKRLSGQIGAWLADLRRRWLQVADQVQSIGGLDSYSDHISELLAAVDCWSAAFAKGGFDALAKDVSTYAPPRLPVIRDAPPVKETIQALQQEMKDSPTVDVCRFTEQQWRDGLASTLPAITTLVDLVREYDRRFAQAKRELRGVDFSDLERFALNILSASGESVARSYRQRFKHVLVDEYQDINEVQDEILRLVSRDDNHFCVGDVKQSIYRFRLAQPHRFLERYAKYEGKKTAGSVIDLRANFRSRAPLLNVVNAVFEHLMSRDAAEIEYDQSHRLKPGAKFPPSAGSKCFTGAPVEMHLLATPAAGESHEMSEPSQELDRAEREATFVATRIRQIIDSRIQIADKTQEGAVILRPIQYRDIVILLRSMRFKSEQFAQVLRGAGVPVHSDNGTGFFDSMEIRDMLALLRVLDNQQQDVPLAAVLRSPLAGLAEADDCLARIRLDYPDAQAVPFRRAVVRYADEHRDDLAAHLLGFLGGLRQWRRMAHERPLAEMIWHIYDQTGYLAFCAGMDDGQQRVANLVDFHERARQFGSFQRQGLGRFMQFLQGLEEEKDLGQPPVASEADDVVRIMSIHRAKGLEFPVVFVPDVGKKHNFRDIAGPIRVDREAGIGMMVADDVRRVSYPSLAHVVVKDRIKRQMMAEELRVLYVAMTRAREHLILVGTCEESEPQTWKQDWSHHRGAFPAQTVLSARSMLDWLGPVSAAIEGERDHLEITFHGEDEIARWTASVEKRAKLDDTQARLARLEPLSVPPPMHPESQRVIDTLATKYAREEFTRLPAVQSVGALTKLGRLAPAGAGEFREPIVPFDLELPTPRCAIEQATPKPTEIGAATHLLLEHLDFTRPCDANEVAAQIKQLVQRRLLSPAMAQAIDLDSIDWLMSTDLGQLLRRHASSIRRELAIYFPMPVPGSVDPLDRVMVRGRVDLFIPQSDGNIIVDFKTDRVTRETVDARAEFYRGQLVHYRQAVSAILGAGVKSAVLVFLSPRIIREV